MNPGQPQLERPPAPRRRWFAFSLRTLLLFVTALAMVLAYLAHLVHAAHEQRAVVAALANSCPDVRFAYDYEFPEKGRSPSVLPSEPAWLLDLVGNDFLHRVVGVWLYQFPLQKHTASRIGLLRHTQSLMLARVGLDDDGMRELAPLVRVRWLDLRDNEITSAGLQHLADKRQLTHLVLGNNRIADDGLQYLVPLVNLVELDLSSNEITDAGLETLAKLPNLKRLKIGHNPTTFAGLRQLRDARPALSVDPRVN